MNLTRRILIKITVLAGVILALSPWLPWKRKKTQFGAIASKNPNSEPKEAFPLGSGENGISTVYIARNGTPGQNVQKVMEMMGGIEAFIGPTDIVVLKPNAQWWNQGMTNTDAMEGFIDLVLAIPGFSGEIIIAENHQYQEADSRGWTTEQRNGKYNLNELVDRYQKLGHRNVTKYHWQVGGTASKPLQGDAQGDRRVIGPDEGDGYVWEEDNFYLSPVGKKCLMTYPVFTSSYSGIKVDLKNGAWNNNRYLDDKKVRFINFSVLNHHGWYCGVTAAIKNLMGVVDMNCGFPGDAPEGTYNTHYIGISSKILWTRKRGVWRLGNLVDWFTDYCHRNFHHTGGALGHFMRTVRMPDLNIISAERVGWGSRTDTEMSFQSRTALASRDPVALDFVAARDVLYPGTPPDIQLVYTPRAGLTYQELNDPENQDGPYWKFLKETEKQGIGNLNPNKIYSLFHDFKPTPALSSK